MVVMSLEMVIALILTAVTAVHNGVQPSVGPSLCSDLFSDAPLEVVKAWHPLRVEGLRRTPRDFFLRRDGQAE